jgi:hypothetical protein
LGVVVLSAAVTLFIFRKDKKRPYYEETVITKYPKRKGEAPVRYGPWVPKWKRNVGAGLSKPTAGGQEGPLLSRFPDDECNE